MSGHILFRCAECYLASICQAVSGWVGAPASAMRLSANIQNTGPGRQSEEAALGSVVAQQLQRQHLHGHGVSLRPLYQADQEGPVRHVQSVTDQCE